MFLHKIPEYRIWICSSIYMADKLLVYISIDGFLSDLFYHESCTCSRQYKNNFNIVFGDIFCCLFYMGCQRKCGCWKNQFKVDIWLLYFPSWDLVKKRITIGLQFVLTFFFPAGLLYFWDLWYLGYFGEKGLCLWVCNFSVSLWILFLPLLCWWLS